MRRWIPTAVTILGAVLGFLAAALYPCGFFACLALASLGCDGLDGYLARELGEESDFGASLDWTLDCALAHVFLWRAFRAETACLLSLVLVLVQAFTRTSEVTVGSATIPRVSGRAPLTSLLIIRSVLA